MHMWLPPTAGGRHAPADGADTDAGGEDGHEGNETPRFGMMEYRGRGGVPMMRMEPQRGEDGGLGVSGTKKKTTVTTRP